MIQARMIHVGRLSVLELSSTLIFMLSIKWREIDMLSPHHKEAWISRSRPVGLLQGTWFTNTTRYRKRGCKPHYFRK